MSRDMFKVCLDRLQQLSRRITRKQLKQTGVGLLVLLVPLGISLYGGYIDGLYELSDQSKQLIGEPAPKVVDKLQYDESEGTFAFNAKEKEEATEESANPGALKTSVQAASGNSDNKLYSADVHKDAAKGMEIHDNNLGLSFSITPQFETRSGQLRDGRLVYPLRGQQGKLVYTPKTNGMKEDIILDKFAGDELSYEYKLDLPNTLEARLLDGGGIGVFSADPLLYGDINYGTGEDRARIEEVRANSDKDHLVFGIPAPVIIEQPSGSEEKSETEAEFTLENDVITLKASGLESAKYPLSIDPSVVVTSSSDFTTGNNEGNIDFGTDEVASAGITGGSIDSWTEDTGSPLTEGKVQFGAVAYNGHLYALGGLSHDGSSWYQSDETSYAQINTDGTLGSWQTTTVLPNTEDYVEAVTYNGYIYAISGSHVYRTFVNDDGSLGSWQAEESLPDDRLRVSVVTYSGYVYVIGGSTDPSDENAFTDEVLYAEVMADGGLGEWSSTSSLPEARGTMGITAYNGYIYVMGGSRYDNEEDIGLYYRDGYQASINDDGSVGTWTPVGDDSWLQDFRNGFGMDVYGGYIYVYGGYSTAEDWTDTVQYARVKADGSIGEWRFTESLTGERNGFGSAVYNGKLYAYGGYDGTTTPLDDVQIAEFDDLGVVYDWASTTQLWEYDWDCGFLCTDQDTVRRGHGKAVYNGYVYVVGGQTAGGGGDDSRAEIRYAEVQDDGSLGSWIETTDLPDARHSFAMAVHEGYVYVFGGHDGGWNSNSWSAPINSDGSLGSWSNANAGSGFSGNFADARAEAYNGYMYVIGHQQILSGGRATAFAEINGDGTVGDWLDPNDSSLGGSGSNYDYNGGGSRLGLEVIIAAGHVYVIGGSNEHDANNWNDSNVTETVEYAPINDNGSLGEWQYTTSLPEERVHHASFEMEGRIYVAGGRAHNGSTEVPLDSVVYAEIQPDGSLGSWQEVESLPETNNRPSVAASPEGYAYLSGGPGAGRNDVYYSFVSNTGSGYLSDWIAEGESLGTSRSGHGTVATDKHIYAIGGENGSGGLSSVEYAAINKDGSIGNWQTTSSLPKDISFPGTVIYGGYIYVVGGWNESEEHIDDVYYAEIQDDGSLGSWQATSSLSEGSRAWRGATVALNDYIYTMGGNGEVGLGSNLYEVDSDSNTIYQYNVSTSWDISTAGSPSGSISTQDSAAAGISWNDNGSKLYEVGSNSGEIHEYDLLFPYAIASASFSQTISTQDGTPMGMAWNDDGTKMYETGWTTGDIHEYDLSIPFDISTASLSQSINSEASGPTGITWNDDGTKMYDVGWFDQAIHEYDLSTPYDISTASFSQSIATQDDNPTGIAWSSDGMKLYETGTNNGNIYQYDLTTAFDISTASFTQSINSANTAPQGLAWNTSGATADKSSVEYAPINPDGSLGSWQATADLPGARYALAATTVKDRIYVAGGYNTASDTCLSEVFMAEPEPDGSISDWSEEARLNGSRCEHTLTAYGGHLYTVGTRSNTGDGTEIQRAQIYNNGRLSNWDNLYENSGLPSEIERHGAVANDGRLYVVGGNNNARDSYYNAVYTSSIDITARDGRYSHLVDFGNPSKLNSFEFNGGGYGDISFSLAGACSAPFTSLAEDTAESDQGITIFPTAAYAQQVQVSFDIDDNRNATYPYNSGFGSITDFTLDYTPLRAETEERLRVGNYFSQGVEQPYDTLPETTESTSGGCAEFIDNDISEDPEPQLTTAMITSITDTSATSGGEIADEGGSAITERGIVYSTSTGPTTGHNKVTSGSGIGSFTADMTGLDSGTEYYVRAYAINSEGTFYGQQRNFTTDFEYSIGDTGPAGGYIFYVDEEDNHGWTYLEAAPEDWDGSSDPQAEWGCLFSEINGADGIGIGDGQQNTTDILNGCSESGIAAELADNLSLGGASDWFLPSQHELFAMYINLGHMPIFQNNHYWSSTESAESSSAFAVSVDFFNGSGSNESKGADAYVRPIRSF